MDLTSVVERKQSMEQKLGILIQGVYAKYQYEYVIINFELHVESGGQLPQDISVVAAAYDASGRILGTESAWLTAEKVFGFKVESIEIHVENPSISRILLYPEMG